MANHTGTTRSDTPGTTPGAALSPASAAPAPLGDPPPAPTETSPRRLGLDLALLMPAYVAMYSVFNGMQNVLLPQQVQALGGNAVNKLAALAAGGALMAALANPLAGSLSDRTRSRFGRRAPWLLACSILAALGLLLLAGQDSFFLLGAVYLFVMLVMGCFQAVITAIIPDRVPAARRGVASSVVGLSTSLGLLYGINMVAKVFTSPLAGYLLLGITLAVTTALFVFLTKDAPTAGPPVRRPRQPLGTSLALFFGSFRHADFAWAFGARAVIMFGVFAVNGYTLYTLEHYTEAATIPGGNAVSAVGTLTTVQVFALLAGTLVSGVVSDRLGRRKIVVTAASLTVALAMIIPLAAPTFGAMIAFEVVFGFGFGAYLAVDAALMTLVLPTDGANARDLGLLNVASTGPQILAQFIAAFVIGGFGGYRGLFWFAIVCAVLGAIAIAPIKGLR